MARLSRNGANAWRGAVRRLDAPLGALGPIRRRALLASVVWGVVVAAYAIGFFGASEARGTTFLDGAFFLLTLVLPVMLIWIAAFLAEELVRQRDMIAGLAELVGPLTDALVGARDSLERHGPASPAEIARAVQGAVQAGRSADPAPAVERTVERILAGQAGIEAALRASVANPAPATPDADGTPLTTAARQAPAPAAARGATAAPRQPGSPGRAPAGASSGQAPVAPSGPATVVSSGQPRAAPSGQAPFAPSGRTPVAPSGEAPGRSPGEAPVGSSGNAWGQPDLPTLAEPEPEARLEWSELMRALDFPRDADDAEGFRALRLALRRRNLAQMLQAAEDVLTLLSQEGVYMDDIASKPADAAAWRRFIAGERGAGVVAMGAVTDEGALAAARGLMKSDPIFRDTALFFQRRFDAVLSEIAGGADDAELAQLADTRSGRAFQLMARASGSFD